MRLVFIWSDGCEICRKTRPEAREVADKKSLEYVEYNINEPESYNYDIDGIPTFVWENKDGTVRRRGHGRWGMITAGLIPKHF